jgi:hemolysin activation/secretion protein
LLRPSDVSRWLLPFAGLLFGAASARALTYEPVYRVSEIIVEYALDSPQQIPLDEVLDLEVGLKRAEDAYVAPRPVDRTVRMRLSALPRDASFGASALLHINQYIVAAFNRRGFNGVIVAVPDVEEGTGRDLRPPGVTALRLRIWTGQVSRVATIADGERFGGLSVDERTNHPAHAWIRERSPVRPGGPRGLLSVTALEDYAAEISRHPGRRMDVEVTPGPRAGTTAVNLRITESKPWYAYAQYANTGTSTTTLNRERFGFTHNQLLGRDDILSLDYTTGDFDEVHAVSGAYAAPFDVAVPEWRFALGGGYSRFDAREAGVLSPAEVEGQDANVGGEISRQLFQHHELFVDAAAGARWQHIAVENRVVGGTVLDADIDYAVPHADLRLARDTATSTLRARAAVLGGWSDTRDSELDFVAVPGTNTSAPVRVLDVLGNENADDDFALTSIEASWSFYLEPLLDPWGWRDPNQKKGGTLAHEVAFLARGQWAMGHRLVPQFQQVAGGFTTVRGYKQSAVVGDDLALGSVEYRFHLPRLFSPDPSPPELPGMGAFRLRPTHLWDVPDWDLIFRVFSDAAYVHASDPVDSEDDETLVSAGGGVEFSLFRNLTLRADVGHTLGNLSAQGNQAGETRAHVAATILY